MSLVHIDRHNLKLCSNWLRHPNLDLPIQPGTEHYAIPKQEILSLHPKLHGAETYSTRFHFPYVKVITIRSKFVSCS
jgi:hypothetical protein